MDRLGSSGGKSGFFCQPFCPNNSEDVLKASEFPANEDFALFRHDSFFSFLWGSGGLWSASL